MRVRVRVHATGLVDLWLGVIYALVTEYLFDPLHELQEVGSWLLTSEYPITGTPSYSRLNL